MANTIISNKRLASYVCDFYGSRLPEIDFGNGKSYKGTLLLKVDLDSKKGFREDVIKKLNQTFAEIKKTYKVAGYQRLAICDTLETMGKKGMARTDIIINAINRLPVFPDKAENAAGESGQNIYVTALSRELNHLIDEGYVKRCGYDFETNATLYKLTDKFSHDLYDTFKK